MASTKVRMVSVQYMMPGPEHHADGIQVVGGARHDVAGAHAAVEIRGERDQVAEQVVAQIVLDVARDADEDHAHPVLEEAFHQRRPSRQAGEAQESRRTPRGPSASMAPRIMSGCSACARSFRTRQSEPERRGPTGSATGTARACGRCRACAYMPQRRRDGLRDLEEDRLARFAVLPPAVRRRNTGPGRRPRAFAVALPSVCASSRKIRTARAV